MALEASTACVIAQSVDLKSALGQHTIALMQILRNAGYTVELAVQDRRALPGDLRSLVASSRDGILGRTRPALTILQYPIWFPLAERFRKPDGAAIFWYHGVTPPDLWGHAADRDILERSEAGTELAWHAHLVIADSPFAARELQQHSGYPAAQIHVVPIGVDLMSLRSRPPEDHLAALRARWGLNDRRVLLYVGRVAGNKRLDLLVEALALLKDRYTDLHLLVVGDTDSLPAYRDLAVKLRAQATARGVGERVTFTGRVKSTQPFYHLAEVCVLPSQHEGFGMPLVEAMTAGIPAVASASGAMPWVLGAEDDRGKTAGLLFSPGSANDLATQIACLLDNPELRSALIERGRQRAECFSINQFEVRARDALVRAASLTQGPAPLAERSDSRLHRLADVALREYRVRSNVPLAGPLIEWLRINSTIHVKEAYLDRIIEQQVVFNRTLIGEIELLKAEVAHLRDQLAQFTAHR